MGGPRGIQELCMKTQLASTQESSTRPFGDELQRIANSRFVDDTLLDVDVPADFVEPRVGGGS